VRYKHITCEKSEITWKVHGCDGLFSIEVNPHAFMCPTYLFWCEEGLARLA
jgi:hypothetical protein